MRHANGRAVNNVFLGTAITILAAVLVALGARAAVLNGPAHASGPVNQEEQSAVNAQSLGHIAFASRSADVQTVIATMYGNSSRIRTASGVFVNQSPLSVPGSVAFEVAAPGQFRVAEYPNATSASGSPAEIVVADASQVHLYSPANNATASVGHAPAATLPPVATIPLGRIVADISGSTLTGGTPGRGLAGFADLYLHPSYLVTSPFFTNKNVTVTSGVSHAGRDAWELRGTQVTSDPQASPLGNGWRMWVDKETGVILRLEYYSSSQLLGWAEMRNLVINGSGTAPASSGPLTWRFPSTARTVDFKAYNGMPRV